MKRKKTSCLIWLVILLILFPCGVAASELGQTLKEYLERNDLQKAREFLIQHLESKPQDREAKFYLGKVHFDGDSSLKYLSESIDLTDKGEESAEALLWMCKYSFLNGSYSITSEQTKEFQKRFGQSVFLPEMLWVSGSSYLITGYRDRAAERFRRILEEFPQSVWAPWALLGLGDLLFSAQEFEQAISQYKRLIDSYADSDVLPLALISLCWSFLETKEVENAYLYYNFYKDRFPSGILEQGELIAKIRTEFSEKIKEEKQEKQKKQEKRKGAEYTIQIGIFPNKNQAEKEFKRFQSLGYTTGILELTKEGATSWRVEVGIFDSEKRAENLRKKLEKRFGGTYQVISR